MIYIIGIGVIGRESLGPRALKIISRAGLLAGGRRHLDEFPGFTGCRVELKGGLADAASKIEAHARASRAPAVVLATGDPLFFGVAGFMIKRFGKRAVEVVPNVSTVAEAFARIKEPWAGARVLSAHGRSGSLASICREAADADRLAVFTDTLNTPSKIASALLAAGVDGFKVFVCEALGTRQERVISGTLKHIAARRKFHPLNVMLLLRPETRRIQAYAVGIPDEEFAHTAGMITKEEIRVVSLSKLGVRSGSVVWDIGAGCGSVSIEAALSAPLGRVYAFEKKKERAAKIRANRKKFNTLNVTVVEGVAPDCIVAAKPPAPDAVFIGGGGTGLPAILRYVSRRLKAGGTLVVNAVTIESAGAAFGFLKKKGWDREMAVISLSKARDAGPLSMLKAANPVFIIKGTKP